MSNSEQEIIQLIVDIIQFFLGFGVLLLLISVVLWVVSLVMSYNIAVKKGRNGINWILLTIIFGWIAVVIVSVSVPLHTTEKVYVNSNNRSSGYSLTRSARATSSNTVKQNYTRPATEQQKPSWTCACGQVNNPNAMRCINCGEERNINHYWICSSCGKRNSSTENFCSNCGNKKTFK